MAQITIINADRHQKQPLFQHNSFGRHPKNTHQILDRVVSKEHCHIDFINGYYLLRDLGSLNGTYVNGQRVGQVVLRTGDEITLGLSSIRLVFTGDEGTSSSVRYEKQTRKVTSYPRSHSHALQADKVAKLPDGSTVTISPYGVESQIQKKLMLDQKFSPEEDIHDIRLLRRDYERLRISYELGNLIGSELDVSKLSEKILNSAFRLLGADRGVILIYDDSNELKPSFVRVREGLEHIREVVISNTIIEEVLKG